MNKKGQLGGIVLLLIAVLVVLSIASYNSPSIEGALEKAPSIIGKIYDVAFSIINPLFNVLYAIIAPVGANNNTQAIAFAVFLLLVLVGYTTLKPLFKNKPLVFIIATIIGVIAARSLTDVVLEQSALGASPIAVTSLILGFLPIYALTKKLGDWGLTNASKLAILLTAGLVYWLIFWFAFNASTLGIVYGLGIILLGFGQTVVPYFTAKAEKAKRKKTGRFLAWAGQVEKTAEEMQAGASEAGSLTKGPIQGL